MSHIWNESCHTHGTSHVTHIERVISQVGLSPSFFGETDEAREKRAGKIFFFRCEALFYFSRSEPLSFWEEQEERERHAEEKFKDARQEVDRVGGGELGDRKSVV